MRLISMGIVAALMGAGGMATAAEETKPDTQMSVQDIDRQIQMVKDQIEKFNAMSVSFDRKASMLQSHDYMGFRSAAILRDQCKGMADDLSKHLVELEQHRSSMMEQGKK